MPVKYLKWIEREMLRAEPYPWVLIEEAATWFRANRAAYMHGGGATWCEIYDGQILDHNLKGSVKAVAEADGPGDDLRVSLRSAGR